MTVAILGPTGFTGRLVVAEARRAGLAVRLVGRDRRALEELADGDEVRAADAGDPATLRAAFDGAKVVLSCAGPFLPLGPAPVEAAVAAGAHYLDSSGEQAWVALLHERLARRAADAGVAVLPAFGFDYVPGDLAARVAAERLRGPIDEIVVAYSIKNVGTSRGTRRTIGAVMGQRQLAYENGRLVPSRFGATTRRVQFPFGEHTVVEWSGTEPLTVPRHTDVRSVRSYVRAPAIAAHAGGLGKLAAPFARLASRVGPQGPSERSRARSRFAVVAEARGAGGQARAVVTGSDVYGLTALLLVRGAEALLRGEGRGAGVLAPAEAFDAHALAASLAPLLQLAE